MAIGHGSGSAEPAAESKQPRRAPGLSVRASDDSAGQGISGRAADRIALRTAKEHQRLSSSFVQRMQSVSAGVSAEMRHRATTEHGIVTGKAFKQVTDTWSKGPSRLLKKSGKHH
jgi:hypothetical protein